MTTKTKFLADFARLAEDTTVGGTLQTIGDGSIDVAATTSFRNKIINGNFDIWQRGTSQTLPGYGSDDRWLNDNVGSSKTHSRQAFAIGQIEVPNNPKYFSRTVVSSVAGAGNLVTKVHRIEDVTLYSEKTYILSFWAKADANKNIVVDFSHVFGTGGSPSSQVNFGATTFALTSSWQKFSTTVTFPSVLGKTLGTNNDHSAQIAFWLDAGSNWNARIGSLGQQSGTFDIAQVQFEEGTIATPFEMRPIGIELHLCYRYYWQGIPIGVGISNTPTSIARYTSRLPVTMRAIPTLTNLSNVSFYDGGIVSQMSGTILSNYSTPDAIQFDSPSTLSGFTAGRPIVALMGSGGALGASAEL